MSKKERTNLNAINEELNALDWDPPLRVRVKNRNRYDVKFFFPDGASLRWTSRVERSLTPVEMIESLREMAAMIESTLKPPQAVAAVDREYEASTE